MQTMTEQILRNRVRHHREESEKRKLREYHRRILDSGLKENASTLRRRLFVSPREAAQSPAMGKEASSLSLTINGVTSDMIGAGSCRWWLPESKFLKPPSHKDNGAMISMSSPLHHHHHHRLKKKQNVKKKSGKKRKKPKKKSVDMPLQTCVAKFQTEQ